MEIRALRLSACATLAFAACAFRARASAAPAEIRDLAPTRTTVRDVVARALQAAGTRPARETETWSVAQNDLAGTERDATDGEDERTSVALGPLARERGTYRGQNWRRTFNGQVVLESGRDPRSDESARALEDDASPEFLAGAEVRLLGETRETHPAYVVDVVYARGMAQTLEVDASTYLVRRREFVVDGRRRTVDYSDYRPLGASRSPWRIVVRGDPAYDAMHFDKRSDVAALDDADTDLRVPDDARRLVEFPSGRDTVVLPTRFVGGKIVVRATIAGLGIDAALDTGASSIIVDRAAIEALGIRTFGRRSGFSIGPYVKSWAIVPTLAVGPVVLHDVVVTVVPLSLQVEDGTRVVALLGYDFLAGAVFHVDYAKRRVTAIATAGFRPPPAAHRSLAVDLSDGVPRATASLGGASGDRFVVDTGGTSTIVFSRFAEANPTCLRDVDPSEQDVHNARRTRAYGIGGSADFADVEISAFSFGDRTFVRMPAYRTIDAAFDDAYGDGLIGADVLSAFDLWIDYGESRLFLDS